MKFRTGILILFAVFSFVFASVAVAGENLSPTASDVALLTGLRADTSTNPAGLIAARVGPIFLHRQDSDRTLVIDLTTTLDLLNASELDLNFAVGYDLTLEGQFGAFGGEVRYFGVPEWSESRGVVSALDMALIPYRFTIAFDNANIAGSYDSELHSVELSFKWYPKARLAVLAGPRYFQLDEELVINSRRPDGTIWLEFNHETTNTLIGGQVGVEGVFFTAGGFSADGWLKAGYYRNDMFSNMTLHGMSGMYANGDADRGTFVGDLGVNLNYVITPNILVTAGYQLLWIEKAALAPEQVPQYNPNFHTGPVADDDVLYQGIRAGVIFMFDICEKPASPPAPAPAPVIEPKLEPMSKN